MMRCWMDHSCLAGEVAIWSLIKHCNNSIFNYFAPSLKMCPNQRSLKFTFILILDSLSCSGKITFICYFGTLCTKIQKLYIWVESKYWVLCISMCIYIWKMQSKEVGIVCILSRYGERGFWVCMPGFETFNSSLPLPPPPPNYGSF